MEWRRSIGWLGLLALVVAAPAFAAPEPTGVVEVRVVGPTGKHTKGAFVSVVVKAWPGGQFRVVRKEGKTDAKGRVAFADAIPPGTKYGVYAAVPASGTTVAGRYVGSGKPGPLKPLALAVAPAAEVAFRIVGGGGKPATGVEVGPSMRADAAGRLHVTFGEPHASTVVTSDAGGVARLSHFLPGEWVGVRIRPKGGDWETRELTLPTAKGAVSQLPLEAKPTPDRELPVGGDAKERFCPST